MNDERKLALYLHATGVVHKMGMYFIPTPESTPADTFLVVS